jgi:hypothetical protein
MSDKKKEETVETAEPAVEEVQTAPEVVEEPVEAEPLPKGCISIADALKAREDKLEKLAEKAAKSGEPVRQSIGNIVCDDGQIREYVLVVAPDGSTSAELVGDEEEEAADEVSA